MLVIKSNRFSALLDDVPGVPDKIIGITTTPGDAQIVYLIPTPASNGAAITQYQIGADAAETVNFDSGNVSVAANLGAAEAYHLQAGHANTPGLEEVSLPFGGSALRVTGGMGLGDLILNADIQQSAGAAGFLYYKDGSPPANDSDGTLIAWSTGPSWNGNNYTAEWRNGEVVDADVNRYYWIRASIATNITTGTVRVRFNYTRNVRTWGNITRDSQNRYTLTGLTNGTAVTRFFRAVNSVGNGPASDAIRATPVASVTPLAWASTQSDISRPNSGNSFADTPLQLPAATGGDGTPITYSLSWSVGSGLLELTSFNFNAATRTIDAGWYIHSGTGPRTVEFTYTAQQGSTTISQTFTLTIT